MKELLSNFDEILQRYERVLSDKDKFRGEQSYVFARALLAELRDEMSVQEDNLLAYENSHIDIGNLTLSQLNSLYSAEDY